MLPLHYQRMIKKEAAELHSARTPLKETRRNFNEPQIGGMPETRTLHLLHAMETLYQMS